MVINYLSVYFFKVLTIKSVDELCNSALYSCLSAAQRILFMDIDDLSVEYLVKQMLQLIITDQNYFRLSLIPDT
jgi:hypothetical protein